MELARLELATDRSHRVIVKIIMERHSRLFSLLLLPSWLVLVGGAFWWFQGRLNHPIDEYIKDELFSVESLSLPNDLKPDITLYHFFDTKCPCTKFNTDHVHEVINRYKTPNVRFVIIVPEEKDLIEAQTTFPDTEYAVGTFGFQPPASPAVLIMASDSKPEYIGPWSPSAICSSHEQDYVSRVLDELLQHNSFNQIHNLARGCLCPWPKEYKAYGV